MTKATIDIARAQHIAIDAALGAAELVFDVAGGYAVAARHGRESHWRNARTAANHNPLQ